MNLNERFPFVGTKEKYVQIQRSVQMVVTLYLYKDSGHSGGIQNTFLIEP